MTQEVDIVFVGDTTKSMMTATVMIRQGLPEIASHIYASVEGARIGFVAHGDFCDAGSPYLYIATPPVGADNLDVLQEFMDSVEETDGGDWNEAYGYVMAQLANYPWREGAEKHLVMIGDARYHSRGHTHGEYTSVWWEDGRDMLVEKGIKVHAIQCLTDESQEPWWKVLAESNGGIYSKLSQFTDIGDALIALTIRHGNVDKLAEFAESLGDKLKRHAMQKLMSTILKDTPAYEVLTKQGYVEEEMEARWQQSSSSRDNGRHRAMRTRTRYTEDTGLFVVPPDYFQILPVSRNMDIKRFVQDNGARFKVGLGFYELTKPVVVQEKKEVVLEDKVTGEFFSGSKARDMIGLAYGKRGKIAPRTLPNGIRGKYNVFIQSTSANRKLLGNTRFLYKPTTDRLADAVK